ncbi:amino acid adenylation domain-containing protein [Streptomyces sp. NPDC047525]|uniref:amino acid adenylation domain-containing protein n=1 Tax=Streptomyces sp. NPDC047525 TaxID=3155264 RepID=UPI0033C6F8EA
MSSFVERDAVEVVIAAQWNRILGSTPDSLDSDFFESGGNSLAAARMTNALNKAFRSEFPVQVVFDARTFRGISDWIRRGVPKSGKRLVTLNDRGDGIPLLLLPTGGGGVIGLQRFGGAPFNRPVFGLQVRGLDPRDGEPFDDLEKLLTDFVQVIEASDLPNTLHLAGYCTGGTFAYELARMLRARGRRVVSVSLFNTSLYRRPVVLQELISERLANIAGNMGLEVSADQPGAAEVFHAMRTKGVDIVEADLASFEARLRVYGSLWMAVTGYRPEPQDIPVRFFSSADRHDPRDMSLLTGDDRDWPDIGLHDFQMHDVEVNHTNMLRHEPTLVAIEQALVELDATVDRPSAKAARPAEGAQPVSVPTGREALIALGRGPDLPLADLRPVHELAADFMEAQPEELAVSSNGISITYGELDLWASEIAANLLAAGVTPGSRVGVLAEPSASMVAAVLGILRCGGAYVPADSGHPDNRIDSVLSDAGVVALVVTPTTQERAVVAGLPRVCTERRPMGEGRAPVHESGSEDPVDHAYVIYTSGSTGEPKGVLVGHNELAASTLARRTVYPGKPVYLLVSPLAFDSSVAGIWGTLTAGGHLVVATAAEVRDPRLLAGLIERYDVTHLLCVPSLYAVLLDVMEMIGTEGKSTLSAVILAGEPMPEQLMERHFLFHGDIVQLYNEYGPTETTVWASYARFDTPAPVTIGRPIPGTRLYVLDEEQNPVSVGTTGELYVGGKGVSRGYHGRPEATALAFSSDPFACTGELMYRTGDLVQWTAEGTLKFVGRRDHQVKIRGHRIELGAVETHLAALPQVREAVVTPNAASTGLIAFVSAPKPVQPDPAELRSLLAELLPPPMVPERIEILAEFPRTINGKVDRAALTGREKQ